MGLILRPLGKGDDPGGDLDDEDDEADSEDEEQSTQLKGVAVVGGGPVEALNDQSVRGHRTVRTDPPTAMNATRATQTHPLRSPPAIARDPKNEVVIAAAAINTPARERNSLTARS